MLLYGRAGRLVERHDTAVPGTVLVSIIRSGLFLVCSAAHLAHVRIGQVRLLVLSELGFVLLLSCTVIPTWLLAVVVALVVAVTFRMESRRGHIWIALARLVLWMLLDCV